MTALLLNTQLRPEQRGYVQTIRYSSDALLTIINDILDFSRSSPANCNWNSNPSFSNLCGESFSLLAANAAEKKLKAYWIDPQVPSTIVGMLPDCAKS